MTNTEKEVVELKGQTKQNTEDITELQTDFADLDTKYVTKHEFNPVKAIAYGFASFIFAAVLNVIKTKLGL